MRKILSFAAVILCLQVGGAFADLNFRKASSSIDTTQKINWTGAHTWNSSGTFQNHAFSVGGSTLTTNKGNVHIGQVPSNTDIYFSVIPSTSDHKTARAVFGGGMSGGSHGGNHFTIDMDPDDFFMGYRSGSSSNMAGFTINGLYVDTASGMSIVSPFYRLGSEMAYIQIGNGMMDSAGMPNTTSFGVDYWDGFSWESYFISNATHTRVNNLTVDGYSQFGASATRSTFTATGDLYIAGKIYWPNGTVQTSSPTAGGASAHSGLTGLGYAAAGHTGFQQDLTALTSDYQTIKVGSATVAGSVTSITLAQVQSACSNDFHNIGGTDLTGIGGSGASDQHEFIVLQATPTLANERYLASGANITVTDGGAGNALTVSLADAYRQTLLTNTTPYQTPLSAGTTYQLTVATAIVALSAIYTNNADTVDGSHAAAFQGVLSGGTTYQLTVATAIVALSAIYTNNSDTVDGSHASAFQGVLSAGTTYNLTVATATWALSAIYAVNAGTAGYTTSIPAHLHTGVYQTVLTPAPTYQITVASATSAAYATAANATSISPGAYVGDVKVSSAIYATNASALTVGASTVSAGAVGTLQIAANAVTSAKCAEGNYTVKAATATILAQGDPVYPIVIKSTTAWLTYWSTSCISGFVQTSPVTISSITVNVTGGTSATYRIFARTPTQHKTSLGTAVIGTAVTAAAGSWVGSAAALSSSTVPVGSALYVVVDSIIGAVTGIDVRVTWSR